ncbi:hypothetical protein KY345_00040, partial [Candidatus Woesearchaeota archaeon]|nr:hypothetical protein [Candidatus Woesearchaeota archaeon]
MNKRIILWIIVMILVLSIAVEALTEAERAEGNQLFKEYAENRDAFKEDKAKKDRLVSIIKKFWGERYDEQAKETTDQKRLERIQYIINKFDLPADEALKDIKAKKKGLETVEGDVKREILFAVKPIPEIGRTVYVDEGKDIFVRVEIKALTADAKMDRLEYRWFENDLLKKNPEPSYMIRRPEKGEYKIRLELWYDPLWGKEFSVANLTWTANVGGVFIKDLVESPRFYPSEKEVILIKGESREFIINLDNIGGAEIDYTWSVNGERVLGEKEPKFVLDKCPGEEDAGCTVKVDAAAEKGSWSNEWSVKIEPTKTLQELFPEKEILQTRRVGNRVYFQYSKGTPGTWGELREDFTLLNRFSWDYDGDGVYEETTSNPVGSFDYSDKEYGNYIVRVRVPVIMERVSERREYTKSVHYSYAQTVVEGVGKRIEEEDISKILKQVEEKPEARPPGEEECTCSVT